MYTDKKVLIGFILGIALGCVFIGIIYDKMYRDNEMLQSDLYEQTQQTHEWMQRYQQVCDERDVLSDCIRAFHDEQECEEHGDPIYSVCHDIMPAINRDTTDLGNWSYCY